MPFEPRPELTDDLLAWCEDGAEVGVRLYTGPGGRGKTRLMIEMCRQLRDRGWAAGFLAREAAEAPAWALPAVLDGREDRFIVVDYAETRRDELAKLLDLAADGRADGKVRFVLLARGVADWWRELARSSAAVAALLTGPATAGPIEVGALATGTEDRRRLFDTALDEFAKRLDKSDAEAAPAPDLTAEPFASALFLHMAALAALDGRTVADATELLDHALRKEERSWEGNRAALGLDDLSVEAIAQAAALVTLAGGAADRVTAGAIVGRAPRLRGQADDRRERLLSLLHRLYPGARAVTDEAEDADEDGPAGGAWLEALRPDVLGEHLVHRELRGDASLIDAALPEEAGTVTIASVLTVLTRLAQRRPTAERWLERAFARRLDRVAEVAVSVAVETGDPIGRLLAAAMERTPIAGPEDLERAYRLMGLLPDQTVALRELRVVVTEQCLNALRAVAEPNDELLAEIARIANNLSVYLSELGRREEALAAAEEAAQVYRELAAARPDAFRPYLAVSLAVMANCLEADGREEEALGANRDAIATLSEPFCALPQAFAHWMEPMVGQCLERCEKLGHEPDGELLAPILEVFQRMQGQDNGGEG